MPELTSLDSLQNPAVRAARSLASKKGRDELNAFLCDGEHMAGEALACRPEDVISVFVTRGGEDACAELLKLAPSGARLYRVPERVMEAISQVKTPQGIAAVVRMREDTRPLGARVVLLDGVQDPGNVGTIIRTADAAGFGGVILAGGCADPYSPKTLRATMGSAFRVPLRVKNSAAEALDELTASGYTAMAAALRGEDFYARGKDPDKLCIVIGSEGAGISDAALKKCTLKFRLPMSGGAESLNAAVAAGIMMYDAAVRQRRNYHVGDQF